jgi:alpha-beta hydrolase superfamily lysophospholipase
MGRRLLVVAACALFCAGAAHPAPPPAPWTKTDQIVRGVDGTPLATTLYVPGSRFERPAAGWPAIVMFHGIGQTRTPMNEIAEQTFANKGYAVLTSDHRGHGESGGLFNADGPDEIKDAVFLYKWLIGRPDIDSRHVGLWGVSLGGGVVWGVLKTGLPFAAAEVYETWVDLYEALAPGELSKSGAIFQFLSSVSTDRTAPELNALKSGMLNSTNGDFVQPWADQRSAKDALGQIKTPVLVFQGRRDFAFGLEQGIRAYRQLAGRKRLYIGDFGHAPSTFPGPDADVVFAESSDWFARFLKNESNGIDKVKPVELAPDPYRAGSNASYAGLPPTTTVTTGTRRSGKTIGARGKVVLTFTLPKRKLELFGAPVVTVKASTRTHAKQLVAVVEAVPRHGAATLVSEGGTLLPTSSKSWKLSFPLIHDTALIARGSKLRLTLSWTTTVQSPANLLYVTGVPAGSSLTIESASVKLPVLKAPIS